MLSDLILYYSNFKNIVYLLKQAPTDFMIMLVAQTFFINNVAELYIIWVNEIFTGSIKIFIYKCLQIAITI